MFFGYLYMFNELPKEKQCDSFKMLKWQLFSILANITGLSLWGLATACRTVVSVMAQSVVEFGGISGELQADQEGVNSWAVVIQGLKFGLWSQIAQIPVLIMFPNGAGHPNSLSDGFLISKMEVITEPTSMGHEV